jgi:hypothetical protein
MSKRYFSTSRLSASAALSAPTESSSASVVPEQKDNLIFGKYSLYPLAGLGLATAISKEILILNDELVYASMFLAFTTSLYVYIGQDVAAYFEKTINQARDTQLDACDLAIDHLKRYITIENRNKSFPEDLKSLYEEEVKMTHMAVEYQNKKHAIDATEAVIQKLTQIKSLEDEEDREFKNALVAAANEYVREKFAELPASEKSAYIDAIIDHLPSKNGEKVQGVENDPAVRLFTAFLEEKYSREELGIVSRIDNYVNKTH